MGSERVLGGSGDLVSKVISPLIGVISNYMYIVTLFITLVTKSHDPLSVGCRGFNGFESYLGAFIIGIGVWGAYWIIL